MAKMIVLIDDGSTVDVPEFSLPSATTKTQRRQIVDSKESEFFELVIYDGGTADTIDWGVRAAIMYGTRMSRDVDL